VGETAGLALLGSSPSRSGEGGNGRAGVVAFEAVAGQPHQAHHCRADRAGEDPAETDAVPRRAPGRLPGQHGSRVWTVPITPTLDDL
jgi:hypothetical protein